MQANNSIPQKPQSQPANGSLPVRPARKFYILERHNPQLGVYYVAEGQLSKAAAKRNEGSIYGSNYMLPFDTKEEYEAALATLRNSGESVQ